MPLTPCPYCAHGNLANAKFCNECGGTLTLAPCPHCGAVNEVGARTCYQCRAQLAPEEPVAEAATALVAVPAPDGGMTTHPHRSRNLLVAATALLACIAAAGYYVLHRPASVDTASPAASAPTETAVHTDRATIAPVESPPAVNTVQPTATVDSPPAVAVDKIGSQPDKSAQSAPPSARETRRSRAENAGRQSGRSAPRPAKCTESVAALGLCTQTPDEKKAATGPAPAIVARPERTNAGNDSAAQCTPAVAALGLCKSIPTQRKE